MAPQKLDVDVLIHVVLASVLTEGAGPHVLSLKGDILVALDVGIGNTNIRSLIDQLRGIVVDLMALRRGRCITPPLKSTP
jgi:hypothetical protein